MSDFDQEEKKDLIKEAIKEWLDEKYAEFGKWALKSLFAMVLGATIVFLVNHGILK